jgi:hypothetical protein
MLSIRYGDFQFLAIVAIYYYLKGAFIIIYIFKIMTLRLTSCNSGGLRLIKASGAADSITVYQTPRRTWRKRSDG